MWEYFFEAVSDLNHSNTRAEDIVELDVGALWYLHNDWPLSIRSYPYGVNRAKRCTLDKGATPTTLSRN